MSEANPAAPGGVSAGLSGRSTVPGHSTVSAGQDTNDSAPGDSLPEGSGIGAQVGAYALGLALAAVLTAASFLVPTTGVVYGPSLPWLLLALAVAQIGVHLTFFLHITTAPDNTNNIMALMFGTFIVVLVIGGSVWIMSHLNGNMMPANMTTMGHGGGRMGM